METKNNKTEFVSGVIYTPIGSKMMPVYERVYDQKTGKSLVVKTDEFDIDEFIQASNCKTDLAMLRQEMIATGQIPVVGDDVVDATLFPENIHEVYDTVRNIDNVFNQLPESVKSIFGTKDAFLASLVDGSYASKIQSGIGVYYERQNIQEEEKKEGEK